MSNNKQSSVDWLDFSKGWGQFVTSLSGWKANMPDGYDCKLCATEHYNETYK